MPLLFPSDFEVPIATTTVPGAVVPSVQPEGTPLFDLSFPRLNSRMIVVEGTTARALRKGPGLLEGSPWPGIRGNTVLAGHRDTHFRVLKDIRPGDEIVITHGDLSERYHVTKTYVVKPEDLSPLQPTTDFELTLITCYPFYYLGPAPDRFIVKATRAVDNEVSE